MIQWIYNTKPLIWYDPLNQYDPDIESQEYEN